MKTTSDCKQFLADFFKATPNLLKKIYGDDDTEAQEMVYKMGVVPKNWSREWKGQPKSENSYIREQTKTAIYKKGEEYLRGPSYGGTNEISVADIAVIRHFVLREDIFDSGVSYIVIETHKGELFLGEYIGD